MQYSETPKMTKKQETPHHLALEGREALSVSGVSDVLSFDAEAVVMETSRGGLTVSGRDLQVERLSLETGDVGISGSIDAMRYHENRVSGSGFFARLFK